MPGRRSGSEILVFTTCYNERGNIGRLIDAIVETVPAADILVVDDNSPDGTFEVILDKCRQYPQVTGVRRPRKQGVGSAHKYALFYAMREGYASLVTMDADWSHDPKYIPRLLAELGKNTFVTGSRYCEGGSSEYYGYRNVVSRLGNILSRFALSVSLHELTTYFRAFDVDSLRRLPLRHVKAAGYSYGVQLIYYMRKAGIELKEIPIHFTDRTHGNSKIPRLQILYSAIDLLVLASRRFNWFRDLAPDASVNDACPNCGDRVLAMKHFGSARRMGPPSVKAVHCTSVGSHSYPPVYTCLCCGLEQVPASMINSDLETLYQDVTDQQYLLNIEARRHTFRRAFDQITPDLPPRPGKMLEVGAYCGLFMQEAAGRGWQIDGVEPSAWAAHYARDVLEMNVRPGFLADNRPNLDRRYDVVVSWDVLEHVRDPRRFLLDCGSFLDPGGLLCISSLDIDSWPPRLLRKRWPWLIDMHVQYFDRAVMKDLLARAGFELIRAEPYAHYAHLRYALRGAIRILPRSLAWFFNKAVRIVPLKLMVAVNFGDIKLYVARKTAAVAADARADLSSEAAAGRLAQAAGTTAP